MNIKIRIKKIKEFLGKCPPTLAYHPFLTGLFLFLLALILGGFLFYKYGVLAQKAKPELLESFLLKEETHQEILEIWQEQEKRFNEADSKEYPDPFKKPVIVPEEEVPPEEGEGGEKGESEELTE